MINNPLACLRDEQTLRTRVFVLDSYPTGVRDVHAETFWAEFLLQTWDVLEDRRESLGLTATRPALEEIQNRIQLQYPQARSTMRCLTVNFTDCFV